MRIIKIGGIVNMEATFSNNHRVTPRYIIQLYSPSFETDEPMYLSKCGQNVWNISWDKEIWKAKAFKYERLAKREADKCRNLIIEAAQKGWTSLGYIITEDGKYVPKFTDIAVKILKIEINIA